MNKTFLCLAVSALAAMALPASAHISLETPKAFAGSFYKAVLRVGHGCSGSPTTAIRVRLPETFREARPMPKPGWTLEIKRGALAQPYDDHGQNVREGVLEVSWRANSADVWLADSVYDEFVLRGRIAPQASGTLSLKVLQSCEKGEVDWAGIPAGPADKPDAPAPSLQVTPPDAPAHHH